MDNRVGTCPDCGGWKIADEATNHVVCDTCGAEWEDGKRVEQCV